jgi:hypothetical protein
MKFIFLRGILMSAENQTTEVSKKAVWVGRIISALPILFLIMDGVMKLFKPAVVLDATVKLGWPESVIVTLGVILLTSVILYLVPPTSFLGAILLTGYLGGAVATQVRIGAPLFSNVLFPTYLGVLLWLGLYLRNGRLRALVPMRSRANAS